jgi:DUF2975 family protein
MITERRVVAALRVFLVLLFGILVVFQTLSFPGQFRAMAREHPELAYLRWPATTVTVFLLLCTEVVIVAIWQLLTLVRRDRIFTEKSLIWVDVIIWAIGTGWLVLLGAGAYVAFNADDPALPLMLMLIGAGVTVVGLLVVVLRALLRQATALRSDLEAVI